MAFPLPLLTRPLALPSGALAALLCAVLALAPAPVRPQAQPLNRIGQDDGQQLVDCLWPTLPSDGPGTVQAPAELSPPLPEPARLADCRRGGGRWARPGDSPDRLLDLWLPAAQRGDAQAQTRVGELYEAGIGSIADPQTAAIWYQRAARQQWVPALVRLAALYDRGLGVPRDVERARQLYRQASELPQQWLPPPRIQFVRPLVLESPETLAQPWQVRLGPGEKSPFLARVRVVAPNGLARVTINRLRVPVSVSGYAHLQVPLDAGPVALSVVATDRHGLSSRAELVIAPATAEPLADKAPAAPEAPERAGARRALIIANQHYKHYHSLDTPFKDGNDLRKVLENRFGFQVSMLKNTTRAGILGALTELRWQLEPGARLLVFYAGHGEVDPATGRGYWIPVNGQPQTPADWVSTADITDQLKAMPAREVLLIVDSCFPSAVSDAAANADGFGGAAAGAAPAASPPHVRLAITSGGLEPVADGGGGRQNSVFVQSLLRSLNAVAGPTPAQRFFQALGDDFHVRAKRLGIAQRPLYAPLPFAGHEGGDFVFAPLAPQAPAAER